MAGRRSKHVYFLSQQKVTIHLVSFLRDELDAELLQLLAGPQVEVL
jgi:hypothetical protein